MEERWHSEKEMTSYKQQELLKGMHWTMDEIGLTGCIVLEKSGMKDLTFSWLKFF